MQCDESGAPMAQTARLLQQSIFAPICNVIAQIRLLKSLSRTHTGTGPCKLYLRSVARQMTSLFDQTECQRHQPNETSPDLGSSRRAHQFHASLVAPSQILLELRSDEVVDEGRWRAWYLGGELLRSTSYMFVMPRHFGTLVIFTLFFCFCEMPQFNTDRH
jgi:hypothetical protein